MNSPTRLRQIGTDSVPPVHVPPGFRRLKGKELVLHGDYAADQRFGLEVWEGPGGFQADSFAVRVYRKEESEAFDHNSTNKPKRKGKHQ